jgi:hypothetical protein
MQQGMALMGTGGDYAAAQQIFEVVIELDPKFAEVRAGEKLVWVFEGSRGRAGLGFREDVRAATEAFAKPCCWFSYKVRVWGLRKRREQQQKPSSPSEKRSRCSSHIGGGHRGGL